MPDRECCWDPDRCGHWGLHVECVSWYWELTLRDVSGLEVSGDEEVHRREESSVCLQDLESPGSRGIEGKEATAGGDEAGGLNLEEGVKVKIAYLLPWLLVDLGSA